MQKLRDLLLPRKDDILGLLQRLKELQAQVKAVGKEMVVCHTDLHGDNLMVDDERNLYILDWEGAMIAPPEHDLFFFAEEERFWSLFLPTYEREFGPVGLDSNAFGFYYYRRNLEDLIDWIVRILRYNFNDEQDRQDLLGIVEDCMSGWPYLETTISKIEARLAQREKSYAEERKCQFEL
jgi:thiamine kinase-like enzyme